MQLRMKLKVPDFCKYVDHVVHRLGRDLKSSVDFHYLRIRNVERPTKFRDHMVNLIEKLKQDEENVDPPTDAQEAVLLERAMPFIACCIAFQLPKEHGTSGMSGEGRE